MDEEEDVVDAIADAADDEIDELTTQLELGEITLAQWEESVHDILNDVYVQQATLANRRPLPPFFLVLITGLLTHQFMWLTRLVTELRAGRVSIAETRRRMHMYANSSRQAYWHIRDRLERAQGMVEERWIAIGDKNTCTPCNDADRAGWVPIGTFGEPGSGLVFRTSGTMCRGLTSCRCRKTYR